jgi:hypothetical protein
LALARPARATAISAAWAVLVLIAYLPALLQLRARLPIGNSIDYQLTRGIYPALGEACERSPGVVLADNNDGHFISYHSRCAVIADNFILTAQHETKLREVQSLMAMSVEQVIARAPYVRYLYVRRNDNVFASDCAVTPCAENGGLRQELLFATPRETSRLHLVKEILIQTSASRSEVLARIFEVLP